MSCASVVGVPNTVEPAGCEIVNVLSGKSVTTSATFHFFTVGWTSGLE